MKYRFGPFEIEPEERRLSRGDVDLHLQPKTFDTLVLLIKKRGHLVSKDELMAELWPDQVVTEHSITRCIREVRKTLGDSPANITYIETVPKAGYRFIAPVREFHESGIESSNSRNDFTPRGPWILVFVMATVLVLGALAWQWNRPSNVSLNQEVPVLAILPFTNETPVEENDLVLTGLVQDIRERLSSSGRVAVMSGISSSALGSLSDDANDWPRALKADWLLRGSLKENEKYQSVMLQLSSAAGVQGWEKQIQIISGDFIGVSDKISTGLASIIGFDLPAQARFLSTAANVDSINAHHQYLLARGLIAQRTGASLSRAIEVLHDVLDLMPNHANAMAALGIAFMLSSDKFYPSHVAIERAEGLFESALQIDPDTALAWAGRALAQVKQDSDLEIHREYINKALELNPYDADTLLWAANLAGREGRIDDAFGYFQRALVVDPLHAVVNGNLSFNLAAQGRYDQATALLENADIRLGNHPALYYFKVIIASSIGDLRRALELSQEAMAGWPEAVFFAAQLAHSYARLQMQEEAVQFAEYAVSKNNNREQSFGAILDVAYTFGDQATISDTMTSLLTHQDFNDENPEESAKWILDRLVSGHGYLGDCANLQKYMSYYFETPQSLEGKRGSMIGMAHLAHWKAWCLNQEDRFDEARIWLDQVSEKIEFMKSRGLGKSTPHMYVEAQNFALREQHSHATDILMAMLEIGWLDQGLLTHDLRWAATRQSPRFSEIMESVATSTQAIRSDIENDGIVIEFEEVFRKTNP